MRSLHLIIGDANRAASVVCPDKYQREALPNLPPTSTGQWLQAWVNENNKAWNHLLSMSADIEASDINARQIITQRQPLAAERSRLDGFRLEIESAKLIRQTAEAQLLEARNTVASFDKENRELIELVAAEGAVVEFNNRVKRAYDGFLREVKSYLSNLPAQLLQGLGHRARDLYNSFNRDDLPVDLLHGLCLPMA
jgi:hypothetical protein